MQFIPLKIEGLYKVDLTPHHDHRGYFVRTYDKDAFAAQGLVSQWIQESHSFSSKKGTVRGMHFQRPPYAETKLVRIAQGKIFLGFLDLRQGSSTFGWCESVVLSMDNPQLLYIPKGLAMGMCTLLDNTTLLYKMDTPYHPESARTILWNDPQIDIPWPLEGEPIVSSKDTDAPTLKAFLEGEGALCL